LSCVNSDVRDELQLAALRIGRAGQEIVDRDDLPDDFGPRRLEVGPAAGLCGVLLADRSLNRLDLVDGVGEHDRGRGPAAEELVEALAELLGLLRRVELGVELVEVVLERILEEVREPEHRARREDGDDDGDLGAVPADEARERPG
jgi:hypothetical protein